MLRSNVLVYNLEVVLIPAALQKMAQQNNKNTSLIKLLLMSRTPDIYA